MKKAALVLEICQNVQPMADVIKVMLLVEPVDVPHGVYMWRQDVLYSKSHLYEAIAKDPRDGVSYSHTWHLKHFAFQCDMRMGHQAKVCTTLRARESC